MMSGGPLERFTKGWAIRISFRSFPSVGHYYERDQASFANAACGTHSVRTSALRGLGSFPKCKRCEAALAKRGHQDGGGAVSDIIERLRNRIHDSPMPAELLMDEAADEIERLSAGWQPIDTAPKDGTPIEACNTRHPENPPVIVRWSEAEISACLPDPHWCDAATRDGSALYYNANYFDFWKPTTPLPAPPVEAKSEVVG